MRLGVPTAREPRKSSGRWCCLRGAELLYFILLVCLALAQPAQAEMSGEDYQTEAGSLSAEEREAVRKTLAAEIAAERARDEAAARQSRIEAEALAAALGARPAGEQLVEARCLICHDQRQIDAVTFGIIGWNITVLRMQLLNGANLQAGERRLITGYLTARNPGRAVGEWSMAILFLGALVGAVLAWLRGRVRR